MCQNILRVRQAQVGAGLTVTHAAAGEAAPRVVFGLGPCAPVITRLTSHNPVTKIYDLTREGQRGKIIRQTCLERKVLRLFVSNLRAHFSLK